MGRVGSRRYFGKKFGRWVLGQHLSSKGKKCEAGGIHRLEELGVDSGSIRVWTRQE